MVVVVGDVSCSVLLLAVVCCDGPLRGGLAGGRVEDSSHQTQGTCEFAHACVMMAALGRAFAVVLAIAGD